MGPTGFQVKELVKPDTLVGGEWKGTKFGGCGQPWWPKDHHQGGGVGWWNCAAAEDALQVTLVTCGAHKKICKNQINMGNQS